MYGKKDALAGKMPPPTSILASCAPKTGAGSIWGSSQLQASKETTEPKSALPGAPTSRRFKPFQAQSEAPKEHVKKQHLDKMSPLLLQAAMQAAEAWEQGTCMYGQDTAQEVPAPRARAKTEADIKRMIAGNLETVEWIDMAALKKKEEKPSKEDEQATAAAQKKAARKAMLSSLPGGLSKAAALDDQVDIKHDRKFRKLLRTLKNWPKEGFEMELCLFPIETAKAIREIAKQSAAIVAASELAASTVCVGTGTLSEAGVSSEELVDVLCNMLGYPYDLVVPGMVKQDMLEFAVGTTEIDNCQTVQLILKDNWRRALAAARHGRNGNFPDDLLRVLLTAFDSRGKNILSDSSSSGSSSDTSSTSSRNSELHSQTSHTSHTGSKSSSRASNSDYASSDGPFGEARSAEGVQYDAEGNVVERHHPKRPKKRSKRIKSRTQTPADANADVEKSTVHMLENLAAAADGVSSGRIALSQGVTVDLWEDSEGRNGQKQKIAVARNSNGKLLAASVADAETHEILSTADLVSAPNLLHLCKSKSLVASTNGGLGALPEGCEGVYIVHDADHGRFVQVLDCGEGLGAVHCSDITDTVADYLDEMQDELFEGGEDQNKVARKGQKSKRVGRRPRQEFQDDVIKAFVDHSGVESVQAMLAACPSPGAAPNSTPKSHKHKRGKGNKHKHNNHNNTSSHSNAGAAGTGHLRSRAGTASAYLDDFDGHAVRRLRADSVRDGVSGAAPDGANVDDFQGFPGHYYTDKNNNRIWKPGGAAHDPSGHKPGHEFDDTIPWEDPYAMELARGKQPKHGRMRVDASPSWLAQGDMYLYGGTSDGRPQSDHHVNDGYNRRSSVWRPGGQGRDDVAIASTLVLKGADVQVDPSRLASGPGTQSTDHKSTLAPIRNQPVMRHPVQSTLKQMLQNASTSPPTANPNRKSRRSEHSRSRPQLGRSNTANSSFLLVTDPETPRRGGPFAGDLPVKSTAPEEQYSGRQHDAAHTQDSSRMFPAPPQDLLDMCMNIAQHDDHAKYHLDPNLWLRTTTAKLLHLKNTSNNPNDCSNFQAYTHPFSQDQDPSLGVPISKLLGLSFTTNAGDTDSNHEQGHPQAHMQVFERVLVQKDSQKHVKDALPGVGLPVGRGALAVDVRASMCQYQHPVAEQRRQQQQLLNANATSTSTSAGGVCGGSNGAGNAEFGVQKREFLVSGHEHLERIILNSKNLQNTTQQDLVASNRSFSKAGFGTQNTTEADGGGNVNVNNDDGKNRTTTHRVLALTPQQASHLASSKLLHPTPPPPINPHAFVGSGGTNIRANSSARAMHRACDHAHEQDDDRCGSILNHENEISVLVAHDHDFRGSEPEKYEKYKYRSTLEDCREAAGGSGPLFGRGKQAHGPYHHVRCWESSLGQIVGVAVPAVATTDVLSTAAASACLVKREEDVVEQDGMATFSAGRQEEGEQDVQKGNNRETLARVATFNDSGAENSNTEGQSAILRVQESAATKVGARAATLQAFEECRVPWPQFDLKSEAPTPPRPSTCPPSTTRVNNKRIQLCTYATDSQQVSPINGDHTPNNSPLKNSAALAQALKSKELDRSLLGAVTSIEHSKKCQKSREKKPQVATRFTHSQLHIASKPSTRVQQTTAQHAAADAAAAAATLSV